MCEEFITKCLINCNLGWSYSLESQYFLHTSECFYAQYVMYWINKYGIENSMMHFTIITDYWLSMHILSIFNFMFNFIHKIKRTQENSNCQN